MPFGLTALVVVSILILFGIGHRILDRMRLNDKTALLFAAAIFVGSLIPDIPLGRRFSVNLGGAVVPFILAVYLYVKAGTAKEKGRALAASALSGAAVYLLGRFFPDEPESMMVDINYVYGIVAGIIAYLFGRSRRSAFIAGIMGVILADLAQGVENLIRNIPAPTRIGGAGAVDAVVISGLLAVILAEVVGEFRERIQGGTAKKNMHFDHAEFTSALGAEEEQGKEDKEGKGADSNEKDS